VRFSVESWSPEYGSPLDVDGGELAEAVVNAEIEVALAEWAPVVPGAESRVRRVKFVDGIRRVDARIWIATDEGVHAGICASYAAGIARCDADGAVVEAVMTRRALVSAFPTEAVATRHAVYEPTLVAQDEPEGLLQGLQQRLRELEVEVTRSVLASDTSATVPSLVVIDGPLRDRQDIPGAIGFIKTHRVEYLPLEGRSVVAALAAGERTPLFVTQTSWSRYCWYQRLPGPADHPWSGIVRGEASADLSLEAARRLADTAASTLTQFASEPFKEPRAPQNLYPIAVLNVSCAGAWGTRTCCTDRSGVRHPQGR
jgi:hypothetical protein